MKKNSEEQRIEARLMECLAFIKRITMLEIYECNIKEGNIIQDQQSYLDETTKRGV